VKSFSLALRCLAGAGALAFIVGNATGAHAQGKLEARYTATLAGIPIGKGAWIIDISEDQYRAAASGATTGLLRWFAGGQGTGAAQGVIASGHLVPTSYAASITADKKTDEVRIALAGGNVKESVVEPPQTPNPDRVPITDANLHGVIDPMTGSIVRVPGNGDLLSAEACPRSLAIFDGRIRYDLRLAFKRMDKVKAQKGYEGPVVVCAVYFTPIAGHIPSRAAMRYLAEQKDMEVWFAPIANTRVLAPFRFSVPTPVGAGVLQATEFVSIPQPAHAAAATVKTQ
jgi:hypothetical protein